MKRKHQCPHCENNEVWNKDWDAETDKNVWVCGLCGHKEPRKTRKTKMQRELNDLIEAMEA